MNKKFPALLTAVLATLGTQVATAGAASADDPCPNAAVRAQQHAERLPDCRAYELVSGEDTDNYDVQYALKMQPDGKALAWGSLGAYGDAHSMNAEVQYVARRGSDGTWHASASLYPQLDENFRVGLLDQFAGDAFSDDLRVMSFITPAAIDPGDRDAMVLPPYGVYGRVDVYRTDGSGRIEWISKAPAGPQPNAMTDAKLSGVSADGSTTFFETDEPLMAGAAGTTSVLYRWRNGVTELVGRNAAGDPLAGSSRLGVGGTGSYVPTTGDTGDLPDSDAVSKDGRAFVYTGNDGGVDQVFLRETTGAVRQLSLSQRAGSVGDQSVNPAQFVAAVGDLSIIYFRSLDQLTDDAPAGGGDYAYHVASGELTFSNPDDRISVNPNAMGGFTRASEDGRYVYFASRELLAPEAVAGDLNLYVRTPDGYQYIGPILDDLQDGKMTVWTAAGPAASQRFTSTYLSDDGSKFVFQTLAQATSYDTNGTLQVYLYDALAKSLRCISCNPAVGKSTDSSTIVSKSDVNVAQPRVMSTDGETIIFATSESLDPRDTNGVDDVYEYKNGTTHMLSSGTSGAGSLTFGMSPDAEHIFILTRSSLVGEDKDGGLTDIYDVVRQGGRLSAAEPPSCSGDACQGGIAPAPAPPSFGSLSLVGTGDTAAPSPGQQRGTVNAGKSRSVTGASATLKVRVPSAGRLKASGSGLISTSRDAARAGIVMLKVSLTAAARKAQVRSGKLRKTLRVSFTPAEGSTVATTLVVTFKRPASKSKKTKARSAGHANQKGGR